MEKQKEMISFIQRYLKDNPKRYNQLTGELLTPTEMQQYIEDVAKKNIFDLEILYMYYVKTYKGTLDFYESRNRSQESKYRIVGKLDCYRLQKKVLIFWLTQGIFKSEYEAEKHLAEKLMPNVIKLFDRFGNKL